MAVVTRWPLVGRGEELAELERLMAPGGGPGGVVLFGDAGVGKTRLVAEVVDAHRVDGIGVEWVRATEAAKSIPLGSFAHLLAPVDEAHHPDDLLHLALAGLGERSGAAGLLLAVDDAHLLDESSVALLHLAVTQSKVRVLVSVRTAEPLPPGLVGLWKDELLVRFDVAPLTRDATEQLVLAMVQGAIGARPAPPRNGKRRPGEGVPASLQDRIWRLSRGNPLFVRELVTAAVERRHGGGSGRILLPAEGPRERLRELVEERLRLLEPGWRRALETVAVGEQVPLEAVERLADPADLEALERRGLVEVVSAGQSSTVQVAHPLYGEVLAGSLPSLRRRAVIRELIDAVEDLDQFDRLRLATWRLESGRPGEAEQLLPLAREALGRLDHRLAERLARAAGGTSRADAGLVLAEALSGQGRIDDAEAALAEVRATTPEAVARVAIARASELFLHLDRSAEAFEVLQAADRELAGHPAWQADCRSLMAQMLMFSLRLPEAATIADQLLADGATPETARVRAATVAVTVRGAEGRLDAGFALLDDDLHASARRHRRDVPFGDIQLRMARFQGLYWAVPLQELDAYSADNLGLELDQPPPPSCSHETSGSRSGSGRPSGCSRRTRATFGCG